MKCVTKRNNRHFFWYYLLLVFFLKFCQFMFSKLQLKLIDFHFLFFCIRSQNRLLPSHMPIETTLHLTSVTAHHLLSFTCLWGAWPSLGSSGHWRNQTPPRWAVWGWSCCSDRGSRWSDSHLPCRWWRWASVWAIPALGSKPAQRTALCQHSHPIMPVAVLVLNNQKIVYLYEDHVEFWNVYSFFLQ